MKFHIACGNRILEGWTNRDMQRPPAGTKPFNAVEPWQVPDDHFSVIYSEDFIEHLSQPDQFKFLHNAYKKLKPGGIFRVNFPDIEWSLANWIITDDGLKLNREYYHAPGGHVFVPTREYIIKILKIFGFKDVHSFFRNKSNIPNFEGDSRPVHFANPLDNRPDEGQIYIECVK